MSEATRRSRSRQAILRAEPRCIYCPTINEDGASLTLEHMPPISLFRDRQRASGMEFASCETCNVGTKGADIAAAVFSLISPVAAQDDWKLAALKRIMPALDKFAPGVRDEIMVSARERRWLWTPRGLIEPRVTVHADGPLVASYLSAFCAKLAMALYREHVGVALPLTGAVYTAHFLNAGLAQTAADRILRIMPINGKLEQGAKTSSGQFDYRFNCDGRSIIAALVTFHDNLHVLLFATSDPDTYGEVLTSYQHIRVNHPGCFGR